MWWMVLVVVVAIVVVFSQAGECYYCGSRLKDKSQRSTWGTRGLCDKCRCEGKELP
jgi:membrane protein DedA with SNARE-associated domain